LRLADPVLGSAAWCEEHGIDLTADVPTVSTASGAPSPTTDRDKEPPMSQQSINAPGPGEDEPVGEDAATGGQTFASAQAADDLLDEIDEVLESNAESFVRSFVQKGGQ